MLVTNHVLSGAVLGAALRRPVPAFFLGIVSHFVLDTVPHWGEFAGGNRGLLRVAVPDGLTGLAVIGAMAAFAPPERRMAVLAGMAGAALPDLDKPATVFFGRSPYPVVVDDFHRAIQREAPRRAHFEVTFATVFTLAAVALLRGPRPGCGGGRGAGSKRCRHGTISRRAAATERPCSSPTGSPPSNPPSHPPSRPHAERRAPAAR